MIAARAHRPRASRARERARLPAKTRTVEQNFRSLAISPPRCCVHLLRRWSKGERYKGDKKETLENKEDELYIPVDFTHSLHVS